MTIPQQAVGAAPLLLGILVLASSALAPTYPLAIDLGHPSDVTVASTGKIISGGRATRSRAWRVAGGWSRP